MVIIDTPHFLVDVAVISAFITSCCNIMFIQVEVGTHISGICFIDFWIVFSDSENTKNVLIASTYIHLKCNEFAKYTSDLSTVCPRILLSGPAGNYRSVEINNLVLLSSILS